MFKKWKKDKMNKEKIILGMVKDFAKNEIGDFDMEIDSKRRIPDDLFKKLLHYEFLGLNVPHQFGGLELPSTCISDIIETIATANASVAVMLEGHIKTVYQLLRFGNAELTNEYMASALQSIFAFAMTESTGGSNPSFIRTKAEKMPNGDWCLTGNKIMITNGGLADVYVVMAKRTDNNKLSFFVVDKTMSGFSVTEQEKFIGLKGVPVGGIALNHVIVPEYHQLDMTNYDKLSIADSAHADARILMGAVLSGIQKHTLNEVINYAKKRMAGNQRLYEIQAIQRKITDIVTGYRTTQLLYQKAAQLRDQDADDYFQIATMAKAYGSRTAVQSGDDAMQAFGAYGFSQDFPIAHLISDARALEYAEGSVEKMRIEISNFEVNR